MVDYTDTQSWTDQSLAQDAASMAAFRTRGSVIHDPTQLMPSGDTSIPIDISPKVKEDPINIDINTNYNDPLSPALAAQRAFKYKFGMPYLPSSYDDLYNSLVMGGDRQVREEAAGLEDRQNQGELAARISALTSKNQPLDPDEQQALTKLLSVRREPVDPRTVFETNYARQFMRGVYQAQANMPGTFMDDARYAIPDQFDGYVGAGAKAIAIREYLAKRTQDLAAEMEQQSYIGRGLDMSKFLVAGYQSLKQRGLMSNTGFFEGGLLGENLQAQATDLYSRPFGEAQAIIDANIERLRNGPFSGPGEKANFPNPLVAASWTSAMMGQSTTDKTLNNVMESIDAVALGTGVLRLPSLPGRVAKVIDLADQSKNLVKSMVRASAQPEVSKATIAEAAGDVKEAAIQSTLSSLQERVKGKAFVDNVKEGVEALPTSLKADVVDAVSDMGSFSREFKLRLENQAERTIGGTMDVLMDAQKVNMLPEEALRKLAASIREEEYAGLKNSVSNIDVKLNPNNLTNTYDVQIFVGKQDGSLFRDKMEAQRFQRAKGLAEFQASPNMQGAGWYLSIQKPLSYYSKISRDATVDMDLWKSPTSTVDKFTPLSWIRTAEDTLAQAQLENRKVATFSPAVLYKMLKPDWDIVASLTKKLTPVRVLDEETGKMSFIPGWHVQKDWNRIAMLARDAEDPVTKEIGTFYKSTGDIQQAYLTHIGRMPSEREVEGYFAWKRLNEVDRVLRNVAVKRNLDRVGAQQFSFDIRRGGEKVTSPTFNGIYRDKIPRTEDTVLYIGKNGDEAIHAGDSIPLSTYSDWKKARDAGQNHVIEIYDTEQRPMTGFSKMAEDKKVRYVIVENYKSMPTEWEQVPRRGGGHYIVDADYYTKQANMRSETLGEKTRWHYEGDKVVSPHINRAEAQKFASIMNNIRIAIKDGDLVKAQQLTEAHLDQGWEAVQNKFKWSTDPETGAKAPPQLNLHEPIVVVDKDKTIGSMSSDLEKRYPEGTFRDGTKQGSLARIFQVQFTGERDMEGLLSFKDKGTKANPLFVGEPATLLDPIPALQRGLNKIVGSTWMDDYKQFAVRQWLQQAKPYIDAKESEIDHAPYWWFNNPKWRNGVKLFSRTDDEGNVIPGRSKLEEERFKINQLIGTPSSLDTFIHAGAQLVADTAYNLGGPKGLALTPPWLIDKLKDPFAFARAMTFHFKLGLFSWPQFLVQSQTFTNIFGIAGARYAAPGTYGAMLHQWSRFNNSPEIMKYLDEMATKLPGRSKWKLGEWMEANEELQKTGFNTVAGEYIMRDNFADKGFVSSAGQKFLNWGTIFFREGEQNVRYGAWYTAYKEFRDMKPTGEITNADRSWILNRADLLNMNMSTASKSLLHTGIFSLPSQFLAYQIRTGELFMSKRLGETAAERALVRTRMLMYNSMLYGVPVGLGATGLPITEYVRKWALENGYVVGDNFWKSLTAEGIPAALTAIASGGLPRDKETGNVSISGQQKGVYQNIGPRMGNQGFQLPKDMLSDKPMWDILFGASGSTMSGFVDSLDPFYRWAVSKVGAGQPFNLTPDHFVQPLREASSFNAGVRWYIAASTGDWLSKKGVLLEGGTPGDKVSPLRAAMQSLLGTQNTAIDDARIMGSADEARDEAEKIAVGKAMVEWRRGISTAPENADQANAHFNNAFAYLEAYGYPKEKMGSFMSRANKGYEALIEKIPQEFYRKSLEKNFIGPFTVDEQARDTRTKAYIRMQQQRYNNN